MLPIRIQRRKTGNTRWVWAFSRLNAGMLLFCYCLIIFYISSCPRPTEELKLPTGAIPHFIEFAGLGVLAWLNARLWWRKRAKVVIVSLIFCALYAASDEIHQAFVPLRSCEFLDWVVDMIGSTTAIVTLEYLRNRKRLVLRRV